MNGLRKTLRAQRTEAWLSAEKHMRHTLYCYINSPLVTMSLFK